MEDLELDMSTNPGQDGSPLEADLPTAEAEQLGGELELMDVVNEESYLDGRFASKTEMEEYVRNLEASKLNPVEPDGQALLRKYGYDLGNIPAGDRDNLDKAAVAYMGMPLQEAVLLIAEGREARLEKSFSELRKEWGENYDLILGKVQAEYRTFTESERLAYDNTKGAKLLGAKYQLALLQGTLAATPKVPGATTSPMLRPSVPNKTLRNAPAVYSREAIERKQMTDPAWYEANEKKIGLLYKAGRIK